MPTVSKPSTFSFEIKLNLSFDVEDFEQQITTIVQGGIQYAFKNLEKDFYHEIIFPLIYGGPGWYGIVDTPTWRWITSETGVAQLGFSNGLEYRKLLKAYEKSWYMNTVGSNAIDFGFGDIEKIRSMTRHPNAGRGHLPADRSWFDWIYEGVHFKTEPAKFRRTGSKKGVRSSSAAGPFAGRMIKYRKPGSLWSVPPRYRLDMDKFIEKNADKIQRTIDEYISLGIEEYIG